MKKVVVIVSVILTVFLGLYIHAGGFSKATVDKETLPALTIAAVHLSATEMQREKEQSETKMAQLRNKLKALKIFDDSTAKYISISFADASQEKDGLSHFVAGFIIEEDAAQTIREKDSTIALVSLAASEVHVSRFTQKGVLSLFIGMQKQYKAMQKVIEAENISRKTPTIHIINFKSKENSYIIPSESTIPTLLSIGKEVQEWNKTSPEMSKEHTEESPEV